MLTMMDDVLAEMSDGNRVTKYQRQGASLQAALPHAHHAALPGVTGETPLL